MSSTVRTGAPRRPKRRLLTRPAVWMIVGIVAIASLDALCTGVGGTLGPVGTVAGALAGGVLAIVCYRRVMTRLAGRPVPELGLEPRPALRRALLGAAIGAGFVLASVGLVVLLGGYTVTWHPVDPVRTLATVIGINLGAAVVEELVFRGIALQAVEAMAGGRTLGRVLGVAVTAAFFGGAHLANPGATLWSGIAIAVEAGVLTGAAFLWKRDLWLVIGLHAAWNVVEGLLGIAVSGHRDPGLFVTVAHGPAALTGGAFGLEASVVPVVVGIALAVPMFAAARRR